MSKDITEYNFPKDLKNMSIKQMDLLSYSIRDFLIENVSSTGGHLASNLGVVELTIALHKVFNTPYDKIIWDVGHQSYVHKILTGRASQFDTLRKLDGLSGFPKSKESPYDCFDTGHSSTSISAAAGMAAARDLKGEKNEVIAVIGDGSLTGGMAYEGLNNIGDSKSKVIVILNDNGMSISPNTGGIAKHLGNLRTSKGYLGLKKFIKKHLNPASNFGGTLAAGLADIKNDIKYSIMDYGGVLFEELGFTYFGPVDGHNISDLIDVMIKAKNLNEPVIIHTITKKGKGYINAEKDPGKFHGIGPFDTTTGALLDKCEGVSYSKLLGKFVLDLAESDTSIVAVTAAMGEATGLGEFNKKFPERFFDVGIAEEHAVTFAAGLAKEGMKPLVAIYSSFLQRGYDQLMQDVCMQNLPVVFAIDRAGCVGADGETHNGMFDLSYLSSVPNMTVLTPKDGNQLKAMLDYAFSLKAPVAIRYPRGNTEYDKNIMSTYDGKNIRILSQGKVDIWACGKMFECGAAVAEMLQKKGIKAGLVDVTSVKPLDLEPFDFSWKKTKLVVTIEDHSVIGGVGQQLAAALTSYDARVMAVGWPDEFVPQGTFQQLAERYGLTPEKITERICETLERKA